RHILAVMLADRLGRRAAILRTDLLVTLAPAALIIAIAFGITMLFVKPAPPKRLTIAIDRARADVARRDRGGQAPDRAAPAGPRGRDREAEGGAARRRVPGRSRRSAVRQEAGRGAVDPADQLRARRCLLAPLSVPVEARASA